jgi:predicted ArsR family transcriptional regulator
MQEQGKLENTGRAVPAELRQRVTSALEDPKYEWRTIDGVAKELGLTEAQVRAVLDDLQEEIVRSSVPDESGRNLYTTRRHYRQTHGLGSRILNALSDKVA